MNYHFVWIPKYRRKLLVGNVEKRLRTLLKEKCQQLGIETLSLEIMSDLACSIIILDTSDSCNAAEQIMA
jgi:REP element-mobilizing transposase RayT